MRSLLGLLFALILCLASSAASGAGGDAATTDLAAFERLLAGYGDSCAEEGQTFYCPNCGGIELTDCLECNGFLNTGEFCVKKQHVMCSKWKGDSFDLESAPRAMEVVDSIVLFH